MTKSKRDIPKRPPGRSKTTGRGEGILIRFHKPQLIAVDKWIGEQSDRPSRPEAIPRLIDQGLDSGRASKPTSKRGARKAAGMAIGAIDRLIDKTAYPSADCGVA